MFFPQTHICPLPAGKADQFFETEGYEARGSNVMRMIGYFSLVGLQRVHALIGDYHTALVVLSPIQPFQKTRLFTQKISGMVSEHPNGRSQLKP